MNRPSLYSRMCSLVSPQYHKRVSEIVSILDGKTEYKLERFTNLNVFKTFIEKCLVSQNGYQRIDGSFVVLNGKANLFPSTRLSGDFICIQMKNVLLNPDLKTTKIVNMIVMYEKQADVIDKLRSERNARLHA